MRFIIAGAPLFAAQHGVVTRNQLRQAGLTDHQVDRALHTGQLTRVHRGVFAQAGRPRDVALATHAAVLAVPGSLASGWSAAHLLGIRDVAHPAVPEVLTDHADTPHLAGVRVRRTRRLHDADRAEVDAISVTSPARTLVDLAPRLGAARTESVVHQLLHRGQATADDLWDAVARLQPRPGIRSVIQILGHLDGGERAAESALEVRLLRLVRTLGVPGLEIQYPIELEGYGRARFDAAFPRWKVALEADHSFWHGSPTRRADDLRRDRAAERADWQTLRFDETLIETDPGTVIERTVAALTARGYESPAERGRRVPRAS